MKRRNPASFWYGFKYGAKTATPSRHPKKKGAKRPYKARKSGAITNFSPTAAKTPILSSQLSELENSLSFRVKGSRKVSVSSDKDYAQVHNEGDTVRVFNKATARIPARPFIGNSKKLTEKIKKALFRKLKIKKGILANT